MLILTSMIRNVKRGARRSAAKVADDECSIMDVSINILLQTQTLDSFTYKVLNIEMHERANEHC